MSIMKLSVSSIKQFKACRRAYELRCVYRMIPTETAEALQTGTRYHEYIEAIHNTGVIPDIVDKESAMANAYAKYILPQMPEFKPEVTFEKRIGKGKIIVGRMDGIAQNAIVEHKTTSGNLDEYECGLERDEQLLTYFLANGCNTAYYTICKKPLIRQKANETIEDFGQRCFEWYADDTYNKIRMVKVYRTDAEIEAYQKETVKMFKIIAAAHKNNAFYRNTCNCNIWGRLCEYAPICMHFDPSQEYVGFKRREI